MNKIIINFTKDNLDECDIGTAITEIPFHLQINANNKLECSVLTAAREVKRLQVVFQNVKTIGDIEHYIIKILSFLMICYGELKSIVSVFQVNVEGIKRDIANELENSLIHGNKTDCMFLHLSFRIYIFSHSNKDRFQDLFDQWSKLFTQFEFINSVFLHLTCVNKPQIDIQNMLFVQLFEPLYELVSIDENKKPNETIHNLINIFNLNISKFNFWPIETRHLIEDTILQLLELGRKSIEHISLREKLSYLISKHGQLIFKKESEDGKLEKLLRLLTKSRNRIAHIITINNKEEYLDGDQCLTYNIKLYFLFRVIVLHLIGVKEDEYKIHLETAIKNINEHYTTL
ncbi:HEPN domain-containing protein [Legionella sp. km772]|uniref:HEPN domain-containing protein n=1 Tax=Legionella sp. km772 TaxID=2498111 RepID=UPI000F8D1706|nr:HEPN domain-containing protein [Legionella sp. km772]RUR04296.1 hypothetical protein ELY15_15680 [Legionella sp. km772]